MAVVERFSTRSVAPGQRLNYWNELAKSTYSGMSVDASDKTLHAQMLRWKFGDFNMIRPRSDASIVRRAASADGEERVILHLQSRGQSLQRQRDHDAELSAGDFSICSTSEPYIFVNSPQHEVLVAELPRRVLAERLPDLDDRIGRPVRGNSASARIFYDFLHSLWRQSDQCSTDATWQAGISSAFLDLLVMAMQGSNQPVQRGAAIDRLMALIDTRLTHPELGVRMLAAELNISVRSVQNLFAQLATTPSAYILKRRLERAAERLASDGMQNVTAVALEFAFNDSAHFSRAFRRQFGVSPTAWRAQY